MGKQHRATARLHAVQALYQMEVAGKGLHDICAEYEAHWHGQEIEGVSYHAPDRAFFQDVVQGVVTHQKTIDRLVEGALQEGWQLRRIESVLRAILRAGTYELKYRTDVPVRVIIKEYVDLAAAFLESEEVGMTNGILDTIGHLLRGDEFKRAPDPDAPPSMGTSSS